MQTKSKKIFTFKDFAKFVRDDAELGNDPIFSPNILKGVENCLDLSTMIGSERLTVKKVDGLVVQRLDKRAQVELPKAYVRETIPSRRDQIPRQEIVKNWPHLKRIQGRIPPYEENVEMGLLIGCNCTRAIKPTEVIRGKSEESYAVCTLLGWSVVGPLMTSSAPLDE